MIRQDRAASTDSPHRRVRAARCIVLALFATLILARTVGPAYGADSPSIADPETLRGALEDRLDRAHVPGMAIVIVSGDEILFEAGLGLSDMATGRRVTTDTVFPIGSTTKSFVAGLMATYVAEGTMRWDDPVTAHLPYFDLPVDRSTVAADVTMIDLLAHRTGFTRMGMMWAGADHSIETILRAALKAEPWAPMRSEFLYNNVMYMAAGEVITTVAGTPWQTALEQRLLAPLGMTSTYTTMGQAQEDDRVAMGYVWDDALDTHYERPMNWLDRSDAAGEMSSNVRDMARWIQLMLNNGVHDGAPLIPEGTLVTMWAPHMPIGPDVDYGLGWMIYEVDATRFITHDGSVDGYGASMGFFPTENVGYVALFNVPMLPFANTLPSMILDAVREPAEKSDDASEAGGDQDVDPYLGDYIANMPALQGRNITVLMQNGRLALDVPGQTIFELEPPDDEGMMNFAGGLPIRVSFDRNEGGDVIEMNLYQSGMTFELPKVGARIPIEIPLSELTPYLGDYVVADDERSTKAEVVISNNRLAIAIPQQMTYELRPPDDDGWRVFRAIDILAAKFELDDDGVARAFVLREPNETSRFERLDVADDVPNIADLMAPRAGLASKLATLGSVRQRGRVTFAHAGLAGDYERIIAADQRLMERFDFGEFGWMRTILSGTAGVSMTSMAPAEPIAGPRLAQTRIMHPASLAGDWREFASEIVVTDVDVTEDQNLVTCRVRSAEAPDMSITLDQETGDIVRLDTSIMQLGVPDMPMTMRFGEFRVVDGVRMPHRVEMENQWMGRITIDIDDTTVRADIPSESFEVPDLP